MTLPPPSDTTIEALLPAYDRPTARATDPLYARVEEHVSAGDWPAIARRVAAIERLKHEHHAVVLAHNYMPPEIHALVGDIRGDSLALAREAKRVAADTIVQAGVHFMAETTKILCPERRVLIPDTRAGCSLAASISGAQVRALKRRYPAVPIVTYVNTSAEVKAESDICCTSSNALAVVEAIAAEWGSERVIMLPDEHLARNVAARTHVSILVWQGHCEVHERFTPAQVGAIRRAHPGVQVLAHPECPSGVLAAADFAGSTTALEHWVDEHRPERVLLLTECSMSDNLISRHPQIDFVRGCTLCPHMQRITLDGILLALARGEPEVQLDDTIATRARQAIEAMLALPAALLDPLVALALREDLGRGGDITSEALIPAGHHGRLALVPRRAGVIAGLDVLQRVLMQVDPTVEVSLHCHDGDRVAAGATLATLAGPTRSLLAAERIALNFMTRLSGIATLTRRLVDRLEGTGVRIACTRKTTPGLRALEKHAVRLGGGTNHRLGLDDAFLIKDNHLAAAGGVRPALARARAMLGHLRMIELEVDTLAQLEQALADPPHAILLDNMSLTEMRRAVAMIDGRCLINASGGIDPERIREVAATGVDVISIGALTHSAPQLDIALDQC
ncbi:quinolinate synthetase /nicotinate-nucleotide pyrophosphorylase [carboxylating] [Kushneria sinocarnis]|uniref:Quinolinate synthase n=1 Tax=Kushneria sinocarnis TaxID=595502 RepID=A0A420X0C1_9GAMM|nr:quinolinate synthase NadA [Kushneria sinocarnis]RKR07293.1 quinolinate synthetase /nicotinate-nucleotide pyrophosphorylase [carboxylating] [Kushneria sinocarnis]